MKRKNFESLEAVYTGNLKNKKGITLVALVVTIIILLILAGISIASLTGNGLFEKAKLAKEKQENAQLQENTILGDYENNINNYIIGTTRENMTKKELLNNVVSNTTTEVTLNDDIKNYNFLVVNIAWRYGHPAGNQNRQYILVPELITIYEDNTKILDILFAHGYSSDTDHVGLCFMKNNKLNIYFNDITSGFSVAVTNIIGYK